RSNANVGLSSPLPDAQGSTALYLNCHLFSPRGRLNDRHAGAAGAFRHARTPVELQPLRRVEMEISLAGRSAIVTGGSKGIGFAIATRFAASGADVAIIARGRDALDAAVKSIGSGGGRVVGIQGDVAVAENVKRAYEEAMRALGKIDIVV